MEKKHYFTPAEKREFLNILKKYNAIIEVKSNDSNTLRRKTIAWNRIACEYNTSSIAPYPASSKQLRRLWINLKQRKKPPLDNLDDPSTSKSEFSTEDALEVFDGEEETKPYFVNVKSGDNRNDSSKTQVLGDPAGSEADFATEENLDVNDVEDETSTPYFVNVGGSDHQDDSFKTQISEGNSQGNETFNTYDNEGRTFDVEFIEEDDDVKPDYDAKTKDISRLKNNLLVREYQDRRRRQNELHMLQKRLVIEQIREARAKANLAEMEVRQHQYLNTIQ